MLTVPERVQNKSREEDLLFTKLPVESMGPKQSKIKEVKIVRRRKIKYLSTLPLKIIIPKEIKKKKINRTEITSTKIIKHIKIVKGETLSMMDSINLALYFLDLNALNTLK